MEFITALRVLWRFRLAVVAAALLAVVAGIAVAYRFSPPTTLESRQYRVALGSATALVDSPSSQVVDLGGEDTPSVDIATLAGRAALLASVMTSSPIKDEIAGRAGIPPDQLIAIFPASDPGTGAVQAEQIAKALSNPDAHMLRATVPTTESGEVPIISVRTQAPDPEVASRLANAAIEVLEKHLASVAVTDNVPADRRITIRQLGPAGVTLETRGPGRQMAVIAAVGVFGLGCGIVLGLVALVGGWRAAIERERLPRAPDALEYAPNATATSSEELSVVPEPFLIGTQSSTPARAPESVDDECEQLAGETDDVDTDRVTPAGRNWASR